MKNKIHNIICMIITIIIIFVMFNYGAKHRKHNIKIAKVTNTREVFGLTQKEKIALDRQLEEKLSGLVQIRLVECFDNVLPALIEVESSGNNNAIGDNGLAVGCLQIHPIMVREVNRILGEEKYTLEDRSDRQKSIEMCQTFLFFWTTKLYKQHGLDEELMARLWNAGSTNVMDAKIDKYWNKVKQNMGEQIETGD